MNMHVGVRIHNIYIVLECICDYIHVHYNVFMMMSHACYMYMYNAQIASCTTSPGWIIVWYCWYRWEINTNTNTNTNSSKSVTSTSQYLIINNHPRYIHVHVHDQAVYTYLIIVHVYAFFYMYMYACAH